MPITAKIMPLTFLGQRLLTQLYMVTMTHIVVATWKTASAYADQSVGNLTKQYATMIMIWKIKAPGIVILALTLSEILPAIMTKGTAQQFEIKFQVYHIFLEFSAVKPSVPTKLATQLQKETCQIIEPILEMLTAINPIARAWSCLHAFQVCLSWEQILPIVDFLFCLRTSLSDNWFGS